MPPHESAVAEREDQADNLPATRAQHPIIQAIDERLPEIAEILPEGMRIDRFRKVVVQALLRNPDLWTCTPISLITAITEAAEVGIEPTGVLGKGWLIPYGKKATFIPGWRGFVDLLWRADRILLTVDVVRAGDEFEYRRGTDAYLHHTPILDDPEREKSADNITYAYALARFPDGREDFEVMSRVALDKIRDRAKSRNPVWTSDAPEMMKKTPVRRLAKRLPLSQAVQAMLGRDEEIDFDTPVERVADPRRDALRERISQRTAAIRGESTGEPEGDVAGAVPEGSASAGTRPSGGSSKGDPWMARLHAMGAERGLDHDALHEWATRTFGVESLTDLDPKQRGQFATMVERQPLPGQSCAHAHTVATAEGVVCNDCGTMIAAREQPAAVPAAGVGDEASVSAASPDRRAAEARAAVPPIETPQQSDAPAEAVPAAATPAAGASPPGSAPPVASSFTDPETLATYGSTVLGFDEVVALDTWSSADFDQVWDSLGVRSIEAYSGWFNKLARPVRQALMAAHQSPRHRKDAAKERPDAEALRMGLEEGK